MIRVHYFRSYDQAMDNLPPKDRQKVCRAIDRLLTYFSGGSKPLGLRLKKLKGHYWEIRASLALRVLFLFAKEDVFFIVAGSHDDIQRHLGRD